MKKRVFVIGMLLLGACGDGLAAPSEVPDQPRVAPRTSEPAVAAAGVSVPAERAEMPTTTTGQPTTTPAAAPADPMTQPAAEQVVPQTPAISVPDTGELDVLMADIDGLLTELSNSLTADEGDVSQ